MRLSIFLNLYSSFLPFSFNTSFSFWDLSSYILSIFYLLVNYYFIFKTYFYEQL